MAKRRLLNWMRDRLMRYASENLLEPKADRDLLDAAYGKAAPLVRKLVEVSYPPRDMKVLKKYNKASPEACVKIQFDDGRVTQFEFRVENQYAPDEKNDGPLTPCRCGSEMYLASAPVQRLVEVWEEAKDALEVATNERREAFRALIFGSNYVDDVVATWPEAAELLPPTAISVVLDDAKRSEIAEALKERTP